MMKKKSFLSSFGIIKEALKIPFRNPSFIIFTLFTSLPLFCTMFIHELISQQTLIKTSSQHPSVLPEFDSSVEAIKRLIQVYFSRYLQLDLLLYKVSIHLLDLLATITTVYAASAIYPRRRQMSFGDMLHESIPKTRWKGPFITSIFVSFFSFVSFSVIWLWAVGCSLIASINVFLFWIYLMGFAIILAKWLEFSIVWNMGVVISILEEKHGFEALSISAHISKGSRLRSFALMLFHYIWLFSYSLILYLGGYSEGGGSVRIVFAFAQIGVDCLEKVMKWVVCIVYYYDCMKRHREKIDSGGGGEDEGLQILYK